MAAPPPKMFPELAQVSQLADYFDTDYICNAAGNELNR